MTLENFGNKGTQKKNVKNKQNFRHRSPGHFFEGSVHKVVNSRDGRLFNRMDVEYFFSGRKMVNHNGSFTTIFAAIYSSFSYLLLVVVL